MKKASHRSAWAWVPSLYFAQGIPYVVVMTVSVIMYKRLGISNADIALYTSWLYLPWVIKPFWSPVVDLLKTKRWWIVLMQLLVGAGLAGVAFTIPVPGFFQATLAFFWLLAFSSATHDIAADGFYMLGLKEHEQAYFVGIRSTFYRFAMITGQGLLIILAGFIETRTGLEPVSITVTAGPDIPAGVHKYPTTGEQVEGRRNFIAGTEEIELSTAGIDRETAREMLAFAEEQNILNGFVEPEPEIEPSVSWFARSVSGPLGMWLRERFGVTDDIDLSVQAMQGNIALVGVSLSSPPGPGEEVVLNTGLQRGDASIGLVIGERLVFTSANWDRTAWMAIQLDPALDRPAEAHFEGLSGNIPFAWTVTFFFLAVLFVVFMVYHRFFLPFPATDKPAVNERGISVLAGFIKTFSAFFRKENIGPALAFMLLYRLGEAQIVKLASPFMLDPREVGGLGLSTGDVGLIYGTIGIAALTMGGILGGIVASRKGLKYWVFPMAIAMNVPNIVYVLLSVYSPQSMWVISGGVAFEQFGYGFGFTAYMLFMIHFSEGSHKTAHYAFCTGFMALGMMLPGMISGWIQEIVGYVNFFIWVVICTIPGFIMIFYLKIDPKFGVKKKEEDSAGD
ncbi:MAG: MFS transporter [Marinilabiliales bacterium]|nr:MAG: MFS transporter [Marinilabiliales bacterium]